MALQDQLLQLLLSCSNEFKSAMLYLNQHLMWYAFAILALLTIIVIALISSPKSQNTTQTIIPTAKKSPPIASSKDITAIAGDDVISTQLDLAKAYIEMDQKNLAKRILNDALKCGNTAQKNAARQLIETL